MYNPSQAVYPLYFLHLVKPPILSIPNQANWEFFPQKRINQSKLSTLDCKITLTPFIWCGNCFNLRLDFNISIGICDTCVIHTSVFENSSAHHVDWSTAFCMFPNSPNACYTPTSDFKLITLVYQYILACFHSVYLLTIPLLIYFPYIHSLP